MSHFAVLVVTPPADNPPTEDEIQEILTPWHEYECTGIKEYLEFVRADTEEPDAEEKYEERKKEYEYENFEQYMEDYYGYSYDVEHNAYGRWTNPNAKWDWWVIGGRWQGYLLAKNNSKVGIGEAGWYNSHKLDDKGVDQVQRKNLDLEAMLQEARDGRTKSWDSAKKKFMQARTHVSDSAMLRLSFEEAMSTWKTRKAELLKEWENNGRNGRFYDYFEQYQDAKDLRILVDDAISDFIGYGIDIFDKDEWVSKAIAFNLCAVVKNNEWYQIGQMGWWGMRSDEMSEQEWNRKFQELVESTDFDSWFTIVDCHI